MLLKFSNGKYSSINGSWTNLVAFESHYGGNNKQQRRQIIISLVMSFPLQTIISEGAVCKMTQRNEQGLRALYIISLETLSLRRVKKLPYYYFIQYTESSDNLRDACVYILYSNRYAKHRNNCVSPEHSFIIQSSLRPIYYQPRTICRIWKPILF